MGRSKEMGKPVEDLTSEELRREQVRCKNFLTTRSHPDARKSVEQRLRQIERRLRPQE